MSARLWPLLCAAWLGAVEHDVAVENTNFLIDYGSLAGHERYGVDYDRLRLSDTLTQGNWFFTFIGDMHNYYGAAFIESLDYALMRSQRTDTPFSTRSRPKAYGEGEVYLSLYRAYGGYQGEKHTLAVGLQKVSFGVGRIWTPTDLFNPKNVMSLEPGEIDGLLCLSYSYAFSELGSATAVAAWREDDSVKSAVRVKAYTGVADVALEAVRSEDAWMVGYEIEGDLFGDGALWRSEGGYFRDDRLDAAFFQAIAGVDYGFPDGLSAALEALYSSKTFEAGRIGGDLRDTMHVGGLYVGLNASWPYALLHTLSLTTVMNMDDRSAFLGPLYEYSLSDDQTLGVGAMLYSGVEGTEFGDVSNSYYLRWSVTF